jgi:nicotinamide mononucleotide adenylyltransferase
MIDYSKPTAQMLGRWQPFHDGHLVLFKEILKKTGQVVIMVRTMPQTENNPFEFDEIKKRIEEKLKDYIEKFEVIKVPNITNICYGRDVGYKIEEIILPKEIQKISATKIRQQLKNNEI